MICRAGEVDGFESCDHWAQVTIEVMPRQHRASHTEAGNRGQYPYNGAVRLDVCLVCAEAIVESEGDWAEVVQRPSVSPPGFDERDPRHLSFTPLDVGFDVRRHDMAIALPTDVEAVRFTDPAGEIQFRRGTVADLAEVLRGAGYRVEVTS